MSPDEEPVSFEPKPGPSEQESSTPSPRPSPEHIALILDAVTGQVVKVERLDARGKRHELSDDDRARLALAKASGGLERIVEQAFEAGIDCVLGDRSGEEEPPETEQDAELSRIVLRSLIETSAADHLMRREVLGRAMIGTLIEQSASFGAATPQSAAAH